MVCWYMKKAENGVNCYLPFPPRTWRVWISSSLCTVGRLCGNQGTIQRYGMVVVGNLMA